MNVDKVLTVNISELSKPQWAALEKKLTYVNDSGDVVISYRKRVSRGDYLLPRGAWFLLPDEIEYYDRRTKPKLPKLKFALELNAIERDPRYKGQKESVEAMLREEQGIIVRPPGTGKTEIATAFMAASETRCLVLVHTEDILDQWVQRIERNIPELEGKVGVIRGRTCDIQQITVATVQTLYRSYLGKNKKWWAQWGCLIADEGHHVAAPTWEAVINACPAWYRFAFTASPTRADGMHPSMRFIIGPIIHRQKFSSPVKLTVIPKKTKFRFRYRGHWDWGPLVRALIADPERNRLIATRVRKEIDAGNTVLLLSRRIDQLENIERLVNRPIEILAAAKVRKDERRRILQDFRDGKVQCVFATQLADEALDVQRLNRVFLVHPGKHEGRIIQQIGRAIRTHPDKKDAVIYDYYDRRVNVLRRQWSERKRAYRANGITIKTVGRLKVGS